jgi:DNA-binding XRE family transcriptional regulator
LLTQGQAAGLSPARVFGVDGDSRRMDLGAAEFSLGAWLRRIRQERGLSQEAVALSAGIAVTTYSRIERTLNAQRPVTPTLSTFVRVVVALEITAEELADLVTASNHADGSTEHGWV